MTTSLLSSVNLITVYLFTLVTLESKYNWYVSGDVPIDMVMTEGVSNKKYLEIKSH